LELIAFVATRGPNVHVLFYPWFVLRFTFDCFTFDWAQVTGRKPNNETRDRMSDNTMKMTDITADCVAAALATPSQWDILAMLLIRAVEYRTSVQEKRTELVQLLLFLQHTAASWKCKSRIVATLRDKLLHFYKIDKWETAGYFERVLFPEQTSVVVTNTNQ
jgi:hypothetical protein